tara:strand:- start:5125 stop:6498 length:1374 start_codon:yes stop_codon:yes gene_type:complete
MDTEILYVILLFVFIGLIAYVFLNCNCRCDGGGDVREGFSNRCACANGTGSTSRWYCGPGNQYGARTFGNNDYCISCNQGDLKQWYKKDGKWARECPGTPPSAAAAAAAEKAAADKAAADKAAADKAAADAAASCRDCEDESREQYGECQSSGYPTCQDDPDTYTKSHGHVNYTLESGIEVQKQGCKWDEQNDGDKIKRFDDKICSNATDNIQIGTNRSSAQQYTIKELSNHCNSVPGCYGWARDTQQGDHKVKLCKKEKASTTSLNNSNNYDVYTCNSNYVCPDGSELKSSNNGNNKTNYCNPCPAGKYKSGINANNCVPCKSSCPSGQALNGSCPKGSMSDTKTCTKIETGQNNSWEIIKNEVTYDGEKNYGYYPKRIRGLQGNLNDSKTKCVEMGTECAAIYEYQYTWNGAKSLYYYAVNVDSEKEAMDDINNGTVTSLDNITLNGGMKYKYLK